MTTQSTLYKDIADKLNFSRDLDEIEKSIKPNLIPKKVQIQKKDGTIFYAVRWVDPTTDLPYQPQHKRYVQETELEGETTEEKILNVIDGNDNRANKVRKLISIGVLDKKELGTLTGESNPGWYVRDEVGLDPNDYVSVNELLPNTPKKTGVPVLTGAELLDSVCISDIQIKEFDDRKAVDTQRRLSEALIERYGMTVDHKWESYELSVNMLLDNATNLRAVMAYGVGGVGKTFTVETILEERKMIGYDPELDMVYNSDDYDYIKIGGKVGSTEMQRIMYNHRKKLIIFDDCDSMWNYEDLINVLKNTLDTSGKGKCQWAKRLPESSKDAGDDIPSSYIFSGKMMFITNLNKRDLRDKGASPISESRAKSIDLTMNKTQTIERIKKILPKIIIKDLNRDPMEDVTLEDKMVALKAFEKVANWALIEQLNTRIYSQVVTMARYQRQKMGRYNEENLEKDYLSQFGLI